MYISGILFFTVFIFKFCENLEENNIYCNKINNVKQRIIL